MPNWCYNTMTVKGKKSDMKLFLKAVTTTDEYGKPMVKLSTLVPLDDRASVTRIHTTEDGQVHETSVFATPQEDGFDGYMEAVRKWGTKWGDCETHIYLEQDDRVMISYDTAWSPADPLVVNISKQFPKLTFGVMSSEESQEFLRYIIVSAGEIVASYDHELAMPADIEKLSESDETLDEYYNASSEWYSDITDEVVSRMTDMIQMYEEYLAEEIAELKKSRKAVDYADLAKSF